MKLRILSLGLLILLSSCNEKKQVNSGGPEQKVKAVPFIRAERKNVVLESVYPAHIKGEEDISIRPRVDGFIDEIYVDEGSIVKKGAPLFKINSPASDQALRTAEASVNSAKAAVKTSELNVEKLIPLVEKDIVSDYQLKTAKNALETTKASLAQAQAALTNAQAQRGWATVTSPVNGIVGHINFRKGSLVNSSVELTTVANTANVYAYFSLNEKALLDLLRETPGATQAEKIKQSQEVVLVLSDGSKYPKNGKIETISGVVNTQTGSVSLRAKFNNAEGLLRSGSSGKIILPNSVNEIVISQKATFSLQDKVLVYKVIDGVAIQTLIEVAALPNGTEYVVFGGLADGDTIISDDINSVTHNEKVVAK